MSRSLPKIEPALSLKLPRADLLKLFAVETITGLEKTLKLTDGTLSKAMPEYPTYAKPQPVRGLSALAHQTLLDGLAERFSTGEQMRAWMNLHWPAELLSKTGGWLEVFYENLDQAEQVPQMGIFPTDYLERPEKAEILRLLLTSNPVQVLWLTGPGGTGKSTLALSLVRLSWAQLKRHYKQVFWVNLEQANYEEGLRQLADSLDLVGESIGVIEEKLRSLSDKQKILFILDDVSTPADLTEWRQLAGTQGKLVVTSRTRLAENELHADGRFHQIQLGGFSLAQSCQFFEDTSPAMTALFEQTGGLPLALRLLSALKLELGYSAQEIQLKLEQFALEALESPTGPPTRGTSLRFCFGLSYQALVKSHPQSAHYFECAGIFKSRTLLKTLLDDVAEIDNPPTGDKLTAILLRYNLVDVLNIKGERFIQLHPLLYEFAREKLNGSASAAQVETRYPQAISDWVFQAHLALENGLQLVSIQRHRSDLLQALISWIRQQEWRSVINLFDPAFELLFLDNSDLENGNNLIATLESYLPDEESSEITLFKIMLINRKVDQMEFSSDLSQAMPLLESVIALQKTIHPIAGLEAAYWHEAINARLGIAKYMQIEERFADALDFLRSEEAVVIFEHSETNDLGFLIALLLESTGEYAQALATLQSIQTKYVINPVSRIEETYMLVRQADCYYKLDQLDQATQLYEAAFAEEQYPPLLRAEFGLSLAGCLESNRQLVHRDQVLEIVEGLMADNESALFQRVLSRVAEIRSHANVTNPE
jgi:tetratricopeptide (TPR) repeat protein